MTTDQWSATGGDSPAGFTAALVAALDIAWSAIQARHPQVPDVIVTVGSDTWGQSAGATKLGNLSAQRRQQADPNASQGTDDDPYRTREPVRQLFIRGDGMAGEAPALLSTLLHEAAHGLAQARGITDTSGQHAQGRYHNTRYRALAHEVGLLCEDTGRHGWSATRVPPSTAEAYGPMLHTLEAAVVAWRHSAPARAGAGAGTKPAKNVVLAACACPRQFRIAVSVLEAGPIVCGVCGQSFEYTTPEPGHQQQGHEPEQKSVDGGPPSGSRLQASRDHSSATS